VKKITGLILKSFVGPFVMTFFIALFILLMQFLWKYVDDLVGKGLGGFIITQLMAYVAVTLVPLALPLAMLLSSIMTFGNLAEHYELVACKSAGMSLGKIMRPLSILTVLICVGAFYFSNNILPIANLKMNALLYDVRNQKPALYIKEGVYYDGLEGYVLRVGKKMPDNKTIHDITIYDHKNGRGNTKVLLAESGTMAMSEDERYLIVTLNNGRSYEEQVKKKGADTHPLMRTEFEKEVLRFDLSAFKLTRTKEELFKNNYQMLNLRQLQTSSDSIQIKIAETQSNFKKHTVALYENRPVTGLPSPLNFRNEDFLQNFASEQQNIIAKAALFSARNAKSVAEDAANDISIKQRSLAKHQIEWNRKFTLSFACLILFFIGAPLGAIIRKGGLGMPVVVSVLFFLTYHIISISGEKMAREGVMLPYKAMWMSSIALLPIGIFLTYKATTDSAIFDLDNYLRPFRKLLSKD
jgi:lipopolysaccharide export system permease protein